MAEKFSADGLKDYPYMTGWFQLGLLSKLLLNVVISGLFGQYADRRLIIAALDKESDQELKARAEEFTNLLPREPDGSLWIDYVADLGDGFDATFAIASLISTQILSIDGHELPRGKLLIMGGDEVYPTASPEDYRKRTLIPYTAAFPAVKPGELNPPMLAIPGNHDWYDGLTSFLAFFCRIGKPVKFGGYEAIQRRSYFAAKLTEKWWVWGIDIQLAEDMDMPQAQYFRLIAESMPQGSNILLCSAEPGWFNAENEEERSFRTMSYAAWIAKKAKRDLKIPIVLSGDTHHYSRYAAHDNSVHFITSGGGGAFLHGTHSLKREIQTENWIATQPRLLLNTEPGLDHKPSEIDACYPSKRDSRRMLWKNILFAGLNPAFGIMFGVIYTLAALYVSDGTLKFFIGIWAVLSAVFVTYTGKQEGFNLKSFFVSKGRWARLKPRDRIIIKQQRRSTIKVLIVSVFHSLVHSLLIVKLFDIIDGLNYRFIDDMPKWALVVEALIAGTVVGGTTYGLYLWITSRWLGMNHNDAFSSMRRDSHRHFLRINIKDDHLKIYPIGLHHVPKRGDWIDNEKAKTDPTAPWFVSKLPLKPGLIEGPIFIDTKLAPPASAPEPQAKST